jgi:small conductance mechanosensitive channel
MPAVSTSTILDTLENSHELAKLVYAWLIDHGVKIVFIIIVAILARYIAEFFLDRFIRRVIPRKRYRSADAEKKREETLTRIAVGTMRVIVWITASLMVLSEAGLDIGPLLAAAGIAGIAVGFGGQYLIRDVVAGFFIIVENQYRVGDVACLNDTCGLVEDISLRATTLRDLDGTVFHISHGNVTKVSNLSKDFARINLNVGVDYSSDMEKVIEVVNAVGKGMSEDPDWKEQILSPIHFERIDDFGDSAIIIKVLGDTKPLQQWAVTGEFRKRLKIAFDQAGIDIPFPHRVVHTKDTRGR